MTAGFDAAVAGGGPAGLMAACFAAESGVRVVVIEKNSVPAKKLRISGKGRCNLINHCDVLTFLQNVRRGSRFLQSCINSFTAEDIMDFFETRGLSLVVERGGRVFPASQSADDVAETLIESAKKAGVSFIKGRVTEVLTADNRVTSIRLGSGEIIDCKAAVIATGGLSYPKTGSTGDGYRIAKKLSHRITAPHASLVPIECSAELSGLQGLSLKNVGLTAEKNGSRVFFGQGEMLFTHYGVSGPLVLTMSSHLAGENLRDITAYVDLKPALSKEELDRRVLRDFSKNLNRDLKNSLDELLLKKLIPAVISRSGIDPHKKINSISSHERAALVETIKRFLLFMTGFRPIDEAIVTAGGVELFEIYPKTMMSKKVENLYFAGEVIDADGFTGGFNLGIAFATGAAAGRSIAAKIIGGII